MWKAGFEIELMAPRGRSRMDLAQAVAQRIHGNVVHFFHPQSEPSEVPGKPVFLNLTPGFRVTDRDGNWYADFVDDLTLKAGLDPEAPSLAGWHRIVSDDSRLLQLVVRHCSPVAPQHSVLEPLAALFGMPLERHPSGMCKVVDARKISVAIVSGLPGERQRPCEVITAPLEERRDKVLGLVCETARSLDFTVPMESATHIHYDAKALCSAGAISNVIRLFHRHGRFLRNHFKTNPACVRLGPWPKSLVKIVEHPGFGKLSWPDAVASLMAEKPVKYCDFNILNLLAPSDGKCTFEVRILPTSLDAKSLVHTARQFEDLLAWCADEAFPARTIPASLDSLIP